MSKRKVTLKVTSQKELIHKESDARTFGELKKDLNKVKWSGMRVVVRETKNTLQDEAAILPAGDFVLFLVPEKVKSGMSKVKKAVKKLKNIATASYNELRSHGSYLNSVKGAKLDITGGTETIRDAVQAYYDTKNPAKEGPAEVPAEAVDALAAIEAARVSINAAIDTIIANAGTKEVPVEDTTEYLLKVSVDDIDREFAEIKKALNL